MNKNALTLIGLLVFLGFPFLLQLLPLTYMLGELGFWLLLLVMILWIYFVEKRTITSIGWKKLTIKTVFVAIGLGFVLFIVFGFANVVIQKLGLELNQEIAKMISSKSIPVLFLLVLRAAVVEEVLYRAYAFERINELTKSKWVAGLVPLIMFMLVHLSWGIGHLLFIFVAGGLLTLMYVSKRNLALNIIAHFTVDVIALAVLPMMLGS
jgi:membrane protease YdiL (CAAX protease family)